MIILPRRFVDVDCSSGAVGMSGEYNLRVISPDGTVKRETGWFPNIILDSGLNRWGTAEIILGAAIGTGSSTPVASQTGLDAQTTYTTTAGAGDGDATAQGSAPYYTTTTRVFRTSLGALNGNYSEVGVGWASGASMFSRALIVDGGGVPTTITVLSTEQLDIIYRFRIYPPTVDTSGVFSIGGTNYTVTGRACRVTTSNAGSLPNFRPTGSGWGQLGHLTARDFRTISGSGQGTVFAGAIGAITDLPSGVNDSGSPTTPSVAAYVNNSLQSVLTASYSLSQGNLAGGVRSWVAYHMLGTMQYDFGASVPKDSTKTLVLTSSLNWARRP